MKLDRRQFTSRVAAALGASALGGSALAPGALAQPATWRQGQHGRRAPVDLIVVHKADRRLHLMRAGERAYSFRVALGRNPIGHKIFEGDNRTPEGSYTIDYRLEDSDFHRAIRVSYPNEADRARAASWGRSPGGQIMIHGLPNGATAREVGHPYRDWTWGCIALTNDEMNIVWNTVPMGTRILIFA